MIVTVTLNPLVEKRLTYESVINGGSNRTNNEIISAGGKGINVSRQLNKLGVNNVALTFTGGYSGKLFRKLTKAEKINLSFVQTKDETRTASVVVDKNTSSRSTFFGRNSQISESEVAEFLILLEKMINLCQIVVFSGSSPSPASDIIFAQGIEIANRKDKISVLDTYGQHLAAALNAVPTIVHNNLDEIHELFNLSDENAILSLLDDLYGRGIKQVYLTNGGKASYASNFDFHFKVSPPSIEPVDPTGSGDAFTAGIVYGWLNNLTFKQTVIIASCLGSANAAVQSVCDISLEEADPYRTQVGITSIGKKMNMINEKNN